MKQVWASGTFANNGPLVRQLESQLEEYLQVPHVVLVANGTLGLLVGIEAVGMGKEVATTPFSYVATTSSLVWQGRRPIFVDVEPHRFTLDAKRLRDRMERRQQVSGILATHVYGFPSNFEALEDIATEFQVPLLFDAAHAFGVRVRGESLLARGSASVLSFHATKLLHTGEGGAVVTSDSKIATKARELRNFGHTGINTFGPVGINAKMPEASAAIGLALLPDMPNILRQRRQIVEEYDKILHGVVYRPLPDSDTEWNYAYYPILLSDPQTCELVEKYLAANDVYARRYFSPSLNTLAFVDHQPAPVSEAVADQILCLPLSTAVKRHDARRIARLVASAVISPTEVRKVIDGG